MSVVQKASVASLEIENRWDDAHAAKLSRPLLIVHGITDDNVHFAHTLSFIEALYVAHKRAEVITLSSTHMVPDPKLNLAKEQVQIDFFRQHLGARD